MYFGRRTPFHSKFILTNELYCRSQFTYVVRRPPYHLTNFSNEFSFLTKLLTVMVCRQPVLISTILELLSTALNCRIIIRTSAHRFYEPDQSLTLFQLFSTGLSLAGDVDMQRLDSSEAFFHKLLIIYSRIIFHAIWDQFYFINFMVPGLY